MTDGVIKGSGNSRYLRTVANARTLYPTWDAALSALIQGTFPVDLIGINSSGWSIVGTKLNKASLLTDSLCTALGLPTSATPTQAMDKLRQLINTAQSTADGRPDLLMGSYVGTGSAPTEASPKSLTFPKAPKFVMLLTIAPYQQGYTLFDYFSALGVLNGTLVNCTALSTEWKLGNAFGQNLSANSSSLGATPPSGKKSSDGKTIYWHASYPDKDASGTHSYNHANTTYYWAAFC